MKTTILILLAVVVQCVLVWVFAPELWKLTTTTTKPSQTDHVYYHKDKAGFTVNEYFPNCSDGTLCSFDGIPYDCVNGKWVVNEEIFAEVKRQGYYTKEQIRAKVEPNILILPAKPTPTPTPWEWDSTPNQ